MITQAQFQKAYPNATLDVFKALTVSIPKYKIDNLVMFFAQVAEESGRFTTYTENLNYSAPRLIAVWPNRFNESNAPQYAYQPEKLANLVYAGRLGNGDVNSGDGWKFIGRGFIQITGKWLYQQYAIYTQMGLNEIVSYMETPEGAADSACWYWTQMAKVDKYYNRIDLPLVTRIINGSETNLSLRQNEFDRIQQILLEG